MAKTKTNGEADELAESPAEVDPGPSDQPAEDPVVPDATVASSPERFVLGSWAGIEQHNCTLCPWNTVEGLYAFERHWEAHLSLNATAAVEQPKALIFGPDGNPL